MLLGMIDYLSTLLFFVVLFVLEVAYFRIAFAHKIIDIPNQRSSHTKFTIRGGGIIFPIAVLGWWVVDGFQNSWFLAGLLTVSAVSFIDDLNHLQSKIRFLVQAGSIGLVLLQVPMEIHWYFNAAILFLAVAAINAWNFMDGINGITGGYSLVTVGTLYYINQSVYFFIDSHLLLAVILSLMVFNYFNFRNSARCFAGDVGSVSIAFIICFFLIRLIAESGNLLFLSLILFYGLDTITTIFFRLIRRENIFEAHRSHFYQFLVNEQKLPHLAVASFYAAVQLMINVVVVSQFNDAIEVSRSAFELVLLFLVSLTVFLISRFTLEGYTKLVGRAEQSNASHL